MNSKPAKLTIILLGGLFLSSPLLSEESFDAFSLEEAPTTPAEPEKPTFSSVEVGGGYVNQDSFKFGDYLGLEKERAYPIVNLDINRRGPYDGPSATYWNLRGSNLGLTSREARIEYGKQGNYKLWFEYDQLPKFQTESAKTVFYGAGRTNLTLPAGWVPATTTGGMTALNSNLKDLKVKHERKDYRVGFSKVLWSGWKFSTDYQHEVKEGTKIAGAVIGYSGEVARSVLIPEPIDYVTDQLRATLGYIAKRTQFQVSYTLSHFDNRHRSLTWANPFSTITIPSADFPVRLSDGWAGAAGYPTGQGRLALPPDNQFHQLTFQGGYTPVSHTRLTTQLSLGRRTQDEHFLPYTVNTGLTAATPLPRNSLDGKINTTMLSLKVVSNPLSKLNLMAHYRYDDRENRTPQAQYRYVAGDSQDQQAVTTAFARTNLPFSFKQNQLKAEVGYDIFAHTELRGSYVYDEIARDFTEVKRTRENTYRVDLRQEATEFLEGGVHVSLAKRNGTRYVHNRSYVASYSPEYTAAQTAAGVTFSNHPLMRKYNLSDRDRERGGFFVSYTPWDSLALQLNADIYEDEYPNATLGLKKCRGYDATVDMTFTPLKHFTSHAFYTYERSRSDQNGWTMVRDPRAAVEGGGITTAAVLVAQSNDATRNWFQKHRDTTNTVGIGMELTSFKNKYDVGAEYLFSKSREQIDVRSARTGLPLSDSTGLPIPVVAALKNPWTRLHSLELYGKYKITKELQTKLSYWYKEFSSRDFTGAAPNTIDAVLATGEKSPHYGHRYALSVFGLSLIYNF